MRLGHAIAIVLCAVAASTSLVLLEVPSASGQTHSFSEFLSIYDVVTYEISVDSADTPVVLSLSEDVPLDIYDPMGNEIQYVAVWSNQRWEVTFAPGRTGKFNCIIHTSWVAVDLHGECSHPVRDLTVHFSTEVKDGQNLTYRIKITDPNRPIAVHLEWEDLEDRISASLKGPAGTTIHAVGDGTFGDSYHIFPARDYGTYTLTIRGARISSAKRVEFKASCNHALSGPGIGEGGGSDGAPLTTLLVAIVLVAIGALFALVVLRRRRSAGDEPRVVTDVSEFEQPSVPGSRYKKHDYSYLSEREGGPSRVGGRPTTYEELYGSPQATSPPRQAPAPAVPPPTAAMTGWEEGPMPSAEVGRRPPAPPQAPAARPAPAAEWVQEPPVAQQQQPSAHPQARWQPAQPPHQVQQRQAPQQQPPAQAQARWQPAQPQHQAQQRRAPQQQQPSQAPSGWEPVPQPQRPQQQVRPPAPVAPSAPGPAVHAAGVAVCSKCRWHMPAHHRSCPNCGHPR